eukprot:8460607-Pyramimonas_sp.AAC.1
MRAAADSRSAALVLPSRGSSAVEPAGAWAPPPAGCPPTGMSAGSTTAGSAGSCSRPRLRLA